MARRKKIRLAKDVRTTREDGTVYAGNGRVAGTVVRQADGFYWCVRAWDNQTNRVRSRHNGVTFVLGKS